MTTGGDEILFSILTLRLQRADSLLKQTEGLHISETEKVYLENYLEFMQAFISGDEASHEAYQLHSDSRTHAVHSMNGPGSSAALSAIHLQSSMLHAFHNEYLNSARHFYKARRHLRLSLERDPENSANPMLEGVISIAMGSVPHEYSWLFRILGIKGDVTGGIRTLEAHVSEAEGVRQLESCLFLRYATLLTEVADTGSTCIPGDRTEMNNPLMLYAGMLFEMKAGHSDTVVARLDSNVQDADAAYFYFLDLMEGEARLNLLDSTAGIYLLQFIEEYPGTHYKKMAWHKLSWHHYLEGDIESYEQARAQVLDQGSALVDADKQALREAQEDLMPNPYLLRARLLFDGGRYAEAMAELDEAGEGGMKTFRDSLEFRYRRARILDRTGDYDEALLLYSGVVEEGMQTSWYLSPNAALHMGLIYEQQGEYEQSLAAYNKCIKINDSAYKNSISYRARQGIERLEDH